VHADAHGDRVRRTGRRARELDAVGGLGRAGLVVDERVGLDAHAEDVAGVDVQPARGGDVEQRGVGGRDVGVCDPEVRALLRVAVRCE
jgi:hypothetical protein